ncbi:hypothetical protein THF5G08_230019 [Vibrio jasicida]|nr:hypothetical protein THF5G08_230019 [Vibrio jasicida]
MMLLILPVVNGFVIKSKGESTPIPYGFDVVFQACYFVCRLTRNSVS